MSGKRAATNRKRAPPPAPSPSPASTTTTVTSAMNLSMIYSALAVHEHQKEKDSKMSISNYISFVPADFDPHVKSTAESKFEAAISLSSAEVTEDGQNLNDPKVKMDYIQQLLISEREAVAAETAALQLKFEEMISTRKKRDVSMVELYKLREELVEYGRKTGPTEELCRNIHKRVGIMEDNYGQMLQIEKDGNEKFRTECDNSTASLLEKIKIEEEELEKKEKENEDLRSKLEQFKSHLDLRKDKMINLKKTKQLEDQLATARSDQRKYLLDQQALKANSLNAQLLHSKETTHTYKEQIHLYNSKFKEFESTLAKTAEVMGTFDERKGILQQLLAKVKAENEELKQRATQEDVALIKGNDMTSNVEKEIAEKKLVLDNLAPECRDLQARRKELLQRKAAAAAAAASTGTSSSCS